MFPYLVLNGRAIPMYTVIGVLGILLCILYYSPYKRTAWTAGVDLEGAFLCGLIGMLIGAKVFYLAQNLPSLIRHLPLLLKHTKEFLDVYLFGGLVFYGGLYGSLAGVLIYCRVKRIPLDALRVLLPTIPLFHAFGRIGCFCMGCCYGRPWKYGIAFSHSDIAPNGIPLVPVQLMEAAGELALFVVLVLQYRRRGRSAQQMIGTYFILYGVMRFVLEFLRGDSYRGFIGVLSVSQTISIVTVAFGLWLCLRRSGCLPRQEA